MVVKWLPVGVNLQVAFISVCLEARTVCNLAVKIREYELLHCVPFNLERTSKHKYLPNKYWSTVILGTESGSFAFLFLKPQVCKRMRRAIASQKADGNRFRRIELAIQQNVGKTASKNGG